jgi:arylsulfatase A-like enzyme
VLLGLLACADQTQPPNIVLYVFDTLRADAVGAYGRPEAATPNLDWLANEGIVFEHAYANASWTRASMASLLTGLYPWNHGAERRGDMLPTDVTTFSEILKRHGYATALVTGNPNVGRVFGFAPAFDEVIELYERTEPGMVHGRELITLSDVVTSKAIAWLETVSQPFFLVVLTIDPHAPYDPPSRFDPGKLRAKSGIDGLMRSLRRDDLGEADRARIRELYQAEVSLSRRITARSSGSTASVDTASRSRRRCCMCLS